MTKHVVVTGGAGFIGSNIADAYIERGWRVTIIDNLSSGNRRNIHRGAAFHQVDIRDQAAADLIRALKPDVINHHAAQMDVRKSVEDPAADADVNVVGSLRILEAAVGAAVKRFVFASTGGAIYGEPVEGAQDESHPTAPLSPYGCAKLAVEHYLHYYRVVHGLSSVALRYANVYGPRQSAHGEAGVVAIFAGRLIDLPVNGQPSTINGSGTQTRDFVYVDDVVAANLAASDAEWQGEYNVGTGVETSVNDLYALLASIAGADIAAVHGPAKEGEQLRSVLDGSRLRKLAALPERTPLRDGLAKTFAWLRDEGRTR
ncbi:MAG TPA: NAD-dependent epimerase/dehydratase family protein [Thermoanaerobaculia bacterium]|jgi:UDP-glucose 4-epimerase|nr:NAD-dependent epimerase/dehydratase family protein [Thermoanaerobaculia bacterium]